MQTLTQTNIRGDYPSQISPEQWDKMNAIEQAEAWNNDPTPYPCWVCGNLTRGFYCGCKDKKQNRFSREKWKKLLRKKYGKEFCFANFDENQLSQTAKEENWLEKITSWAEQNEKPFLFLYHLKSGQSKTFLAFEAARMKSEYAHKAHICCPLLVNCEKVWGLTFPEKKRLSEAAEDAQILILDDIGKGHKNAGVLLFSIIKDRAALKKITIFTSQATLPEIKELYEEQESGDAIARRIKEEAKII